MRRRNTICAFLVLATAAPRAFAGFAPKKESTQIEFNQLIDENDRTTRALVKTDPRPIPAPAGRGEVADFIDVEIGVGQAPTLTDRR